MTYLGINNILKFNLLPEKTRTNKKYTKIKT